MDFLWGDVVPCEPSINFVTLSLDYLCNFLYMPIFVGGGTKKANRRPILHRMQLEDSTSIATCSLCLISVQGYDVGC
jgi:hypothetical protein